jgi:hypothetical protein
VPPGARRCCAPFWRNVQIISPCLVRTSTPHPHCPPPVIPRLLSLVAMNYLFWAFIFIYICLYVTIISVNLHHFFCTVFTNDWPRAMATVTRDFVGQTRSGSVSFFQYRFTVEGTNFCGRFVVDPAPRRGWQWLETTNAEALLTKLDGLTVQIKYNPSNPKISLLADYYDPRFDGGLASQNPFHFIFPSRMTR